MEEEGDDPRELTREVGWDVEDDKDDDGRTNGELREGSGYVAGTRTWNRFSRSKSTRRLYSTTRLRTRTLDPLSIASIDSKIDMT